MLSNLYLGAMFFTQNDIRRLAFRLPPVAGGDELMDNKNFTKNVRVAKKIKEGGEEEDGDGAEDS